MDHFRVYQDISARTGGEIYIGVVGPVRSGKSTFIKQAVYKVIRRNPQKYGFKQIDYLGQENKVMRRVIVMFIITCALYMVLSMLYVYVVFPNISVTDLHLL